LPPVTVVQRPWPPIVSVRIVIGSGSLADPAGQEGMAQLCWSAALRGAGARDRAALAEALDSLGASLDESVDKIGTVIAGSVPVEELDAFVALAADAVLRPRFDATEVAEARKSLLGDLVLLRDDDESLAHDALGRFLYRGQLLGRPTTGTEQSLPRIEADHVRAWHKQQVVLGNVRIGFAGDITQDRADVLVQKYFAGLRPGNTTAVRVQRPEADGRRLLLLDKPGSSQAQILFAQPVLAAGSKDLPALLVANTVLGGSFTSRLVREIRELRGWAYNTWSAVAAGPQVSTLAIGMATGNADAPAALDLAVKVLGELKREGVTPAELRLAKDYLKGSHRYSLETADRELNQRMRAA
jgi:zinc protease